MEVRTNGGMDGWLDGWMDGFKDEGDSTSVITHNLEHFREQTMELLILLCARFAQLVRSLAANQKVPDSILGQVEG